MIIVRNSFRIKFGQAKPALAAFKEGREVMAKVGLTGKTRVLTDVTGPSYTICSKPSTRASPDSSRNRSR